MLKRALFGASVAFMAVCLAGPVKAVERSDIPRNINGI